MVTFSDIADYRDFLKSYYDRRKEEMPFYSYRMMGDKLGLDSSYLYRVLQKSSTCRHMRCRRPKSPGLVGAFC
jgi:hypothetical protein